MIYKKIKEYAPERVIFAYLGILLAGIASGCIIFSYFYIYKFLEKIIVINDIEGAIKTSVLVVSMLIIQGILYFLSLFATHILAFRLESNLKKEGIKKLSTASFSFYDKNESGRIRKIIDDNTGLTHMSVAHLIPDLSTALTTPIFGLIMVFYVDYRLGILFIMTIVAGLITISQMMGDKNFMSEYMKAQERMNAGSVEYVRGINVLKIFKTNVKSLKEFYQSVIDYSKLALQYSMSCRTWFVLFQIFFNSVFLILIFIYDFTNLQSSVFLAKFLFYVIFNGIIYATFMKVMYVSMYTFQSTTAIQKIENIFEEMDEKKLPTGSLTSMENHSIEFKNVSFGYEDNLVLDNLSFKLEQDKTYALVGNSGSGKTTIAKLISGFYKLNSGDILIGNHSISEYSDEALAMNIANVFQDAKLFKKSIYENVQIGNPNASKEEVLEALHLAQCDDILDKFTTRENTIIGSKGVYLSGGETQRITIARAILKQAKIVIMDEASAAADPENEYELQKALSNLMKGKTVIMIAHRLSSIKEVDEILVIKKGELIERGSHNDLISKNSIYKNLQEQYAKANEWRIK